MGSASNTKRAHPSLYQGYLKSLPFGLWSGNQLRTTPRLRSGTDPHTNTSGQSPCQSHRKKQKNKKLTPSSQLSSHIHKTHLDPVPAHRQALAPEDLVALSLVHTATETWKIKEVSLEGSSKRLLPGLSLAPREGKLLNSEECTKLKPEETQEMTTGPLRGLHRGSRPPQLMAALQQGPQIEEVCTGLGSCLRPRIQAGTSH